MNELLKKSQTLRDIDRLTAAWGSDYAQADVNWDGTVGLNDLLDASSAQGNTYSNTLIGDIDGNCAVDRVDTALIQVSIGTAWVQADLDGDGLVGTGDLLTVLGNVGSVCE